MRGDRLGSIPTFRLAYVPGVTPAKWVRIWNERLPDVPLTLVPVPAADASDVLRRGEADAGLVRLPVDRTVLSAIPLYTEATVVVAPKDHVVTAAEEVSLDELADEVVLHPLDDVLGWEQPPGSPRSSVPRPPRTPSNTWRRASASSTSPVPGPPAPPQGPHLPDGPRRPQSDVALSWPEDATTDLVEDFIGIVRGRTVNSTRGRTPTPPQPKTKAKRPEPAGKRKPAAGKAGGKSTGKNPRGASGGAKGAKRGKPRGR